MENNEELKLRLAKEISDLWFECKIRWDRIEEITKQIKEMNEKKF